MCNDKKWFLDLNESVQGDVCTAGEHRIKSFGVGEIRMDIKLNRQVYNNIKLKDVIYVPNLRNNLVSVPSITEKGYTVTFRKNKATINRPDGSTAATAIRSGQLYIMCESESQVLQSVRNQSIDLMRWHQRYGHLNVNDLKRLAVNDMVSGLNITSTMDNLNCEICKKCKIHQLPYRSSENRAKSVLELVHSDICGPIETESLGGAKYFATFIDDHSRYTEIVVLRNRSEILNAFKDYKRRVEKETGHQIKKLRTDNTLEYKSKDFSDFLRREGISRQLSVEYTPQQNVAERANRTLVEMSRCLILQTNLPKSLWAEMVNTAAFIRNRCPSKILGDKTPFELWNNRKPFIGFMKIIGSKAIALEKGRRLSKFEPKGIEYVLVGYSNESKAYRLWQRGTRKIIKSRDVRFIEEVGESLRRSTEISLLPLEPNLDQYKIPDDDVITKQTNEYEENSNESSNDEEQVSDGEEMSHSRETQDDENEIKLKRGPGRPSYIKTGKPGRKRCTRKNKQIYYLH